MAIADHLIFCAYGFWLPNDPRGSRSDFIRAWEILLAGRATKTASRRSVAHLHADFSDDHQPRLQFPPVTFTGRQALAIARGFTAAIEESGYILYACSILPEHIHAVVKRDAHRPKQIAGHLKGRATQALAAEKLHPLAGFKDRANPPSPPTPWARNSWDVYLDTPADVRRSIEYVRNNPIKDGHKPQSWNLLTPYAG